MENKIDLQEGDVCLIYSEAFYDTEGEETEEVEILSIRGDTMEVHRNRTDLSPLNKYWTFTGNYFKPEWVAMVLYNKYDDDERPTYEEMEKYTKVAVGSKDEVNKALGIGEYSESHYDNYYVLTEKDIKEGKIKMDAYFVAKVWRTGSRDDSGALWHFKPRNKYDREIVPFIYCDVYDVLRAFDVKDQALAHLVKKALAVGQRGHKDAEEDYKDILDSAKRAFDQFLVWKQRNEYEG